MKHELKRNWLMFDFETWKLVIVNCITDFEEEKEKSILSFWIDGLRKKQEIGLNKWLICLIWLIVFCVDFEIQKWEMCDEKETKEIKKKQTERKSKIKQSFNNG